MPPPKHKVEALIEHDLKWVVTTNPDRRREAQDVIHLAYETQRHWQAACGTRLKLASSVSPGSWVYRKCMRCAEYEREISTRTALAC